MAWGKILVHLSAFAEWREKRAKRRKNKMYLLRIVYFNNALKCVKKLSVHVSCTSFLLDYLYLSDNCSCWCCPSRWLKCEDWAGREMIIYTSLSRLLTSLSILYNIVFIYIFPHPEMVISHHTDTRYWLCTHGFNYIDVRIVEKGVMLIWRTDSCVLCVLFKLSLYFDMLTCSSACLTVFFVFVPPTQKKKLWSCLQKMLNTKQPKTLKLKQW